MWLLGLKKNIMHEALSSNPSTKVQCVLCVYTSYIILYHCSNNIVKNAATCFTLDLVLGCLEVRNLKWSQGYKEGYAPCHLQLCGACQCLVACFTELRVTPKTQACHTVYPLSYIPGLGCGPFKAVFEVHPSYCHVRGIHISLWLL